MPYLDVAIVGAGVAGLAAARELRRSKRRVAVFEARDRIGGRVHTLYEPDLPLPIELGAEFVHGDAPHTARILNEANLLAVELAGEHRVARRGSVRSVDFRKSVDRVLGRIDARAPDRSFADFLAQRPGGRSFARDRTTAAEFVQGFHAADLNEISAQSLAPGEGESPSESAVRAARVVEGQLSIARWLVRGLESLIHTRAPVSEIAWERGRAEIRVGARRIVARAVVITAPLGVLAARGIALRPDPPRIRRAIEGLAMGAVTRVTFRFSEPPWKKLERVSFIHTRDGPFNVWWTSFPAHAPLAVAWSGGPPARTIDPERAVDAAIDGLARALGQTKRRIASKLKKTWSHDWIRDPFARGAYAYIRAGHAGAPELLARPVDGTLFFAGEATDTENMGTVEGAIGSGMRAARQVHAALARRSLLRSGAR